MKGQHGHLAQLLVVLGTLSVARACAYQEMWMENPSDYMYRRCLVGCSDIKPSDQKYESCCIPLFNGAQAPATCSELASSVAAKSTTCAWQPVRTTDSTGYAAPTSYSTAARPSSTMTSAKPYTSGIEGQSISYETGSAGTVTEWITTTLPAPCEPTAAPSTTESANTNTNTCECTDYATSSTAEPSSSSSSWAPETSGIEGSAYSSDVPSSSWTSTSFASDIGAWAGAAPPADFTAGLDRRTEKEYTCACPAATVSSSSYAPSDTSDVQGQAYTSSSNASSSSSSSAEYTQPTSSSLVEYTTSTVASDSGAWAGSTPPEGSEIVENAKRFLPTIYGPGPGATGPAVKRLQDPVRDAGAQLTKRTYDETTVAAAESGGLETVTSTVTETGVCSVTDSYSTSNAAEPTSSETACDPASDEGAWAGATATESVTENADVHRRRIRRKF